MRRERRMLGLSVGQGLIGKLCLLWLAVGSTNCAKTPPSNYYILTGLKDELNQEQSSKVMKVGVGPIKLPGRLDRAQILTRQGLNVLKIHEYHRWGDSLQRQLEEVLAQNLSAHLKETQVVVYPWEHALRPKYQVLVTVRNFEGNLSSGTDLSVVWQLVDVKEDQLILSKQFNVMIPTSQPTMTSYIDSQSQALIKLSETIAQQINELNQDPMPSPRLRKY